VCEGTLAFAGVCDDSIFMAFAREQPHRCLSCWYEAQEADCSRF
jgi:hypothetical protein